MAVEISAFIASASSIFELGKVILNARDGHISAAIKADFTEKLIAGQAQLAQVLGTIVEQEGRIQTLTKRVRELEAEQSEKARYRLAKIGAVGEQFAYQLRPAAELVERADEPPHFLCQPCFDAGKKSVLRQSSTTAYCTLCKATIPTAQGKPPTVRQVVNPGLTSWNRRDW